MGLQALPPAAATAAGHAEQMSTEIVDKLVDKPCVPPPNARPGCVLASMLKNAAPIYSINSSTCTTVTVS
jgi:hypothetical protein